jgi:hypothetical protein
MPKNTSMRRIGCSRRSRRRRASFVHASLSICGSAPQTKRVKNASPTEGLHALPPAGQAEHRQSIWWRSTELPMSRDRKPPRRPFDRFDAIGLALLGIIAAFWIAHFFAAGTATKRALIAPPCLVKPAGSAPRASCRKTSTRYRSGAACQGTLDRRRRVSYAPNFRRIAAQR